MAPATKRPKRNRGPLSQDRILDSDSPIMTKDIHAFLVTCISGWDHNYDESEKRGIIDSLPEPHRKYQVDDQGRLLCPINIDFVHGDPYVKAAISKFKKDVADGCYEKSWQTKARRAMRERAEGKFDEYLREHAEELFGEHAGRGGMEDEGVLDKEPSSDGDWDGSSTRKSKKATKTVSWSRSEDVRP